MSNNAAIARRWYAEAWRENGESTVDELMAPDIKGLMEGGPIDGREQFKEARRQLLAIFPDLELTVEDVIEQDDKVAVRWKAEATHRGAGMGMAATNRHVAFRGMTWLELRNGQIVRGWDSWNMGALVMTLAAPG